MVTPFRLRILLLLLALAVVLQCHQCQATTYATWIAGYPSLTGDNDNPEADPDADGISNLMEYALTGCDPTVFTAASALPTMVLQDQASDNSWGSIFTNPATALVSGSNRHVVLKYQKRSGITDLEYIPEMNSRTLSGWHWGNSAFTAWDDGGYSYARANSPFNIWDRQFLRLKVKLI